MWKKAVIGACMVGWILGSAGCASSTGARMPASSAPDIEWITRGASLLEGAQQERARSAVMQAWDFVRTSPFTAGAEPQRFAVILDSDWNLSGGYFSPDLRGSDGRPAVLFNPRSVLASSRPVGMIVHELTHLIHYGRVSDEEGWLREGLAMLMEWKSSGAYPPSMLEGIRRPETSLTASLDPDHRGRRPSIEVVAQYGHIFQLMAYLDRVCGGERWWPRVFGGASSARGVARIDEALRAIALDGGAADPVCASFETVFVAFERARFRSDPLRASGYVLMVGTQPPVREERMELGPYSAGAYRTAGACASGDLSLAARTCLRVRLR